MFSLSQELLTQIAPQWLERLVSHVKVVLEFKPGNTIMSASQGTMFVAAAPDVFSHQFPSVPIPVLRPGQTMSGMIVILPPTSFTIVASAAPQLSVASAEAAAHFFYTPRRNRGLIGDLHRVETI